MIEEFKVENIQQAFISDPSVHMKTGQRAQLWLDIQEGGRWTGLPASGEARLLEKTLQPRKQRTGFESLLHH